MPGVEKHKVKTKAKIESKPAIPQKGLLIDLTNLDNMSCKFFGDDWHKHDLRRAYALMNREYKLLLRNLRKESK